MNFKRIPIQNADNTELLRISQDGLLSLNLTEMQAIQSHFAGISRDPTDVEIETLAQTWSEHCVHKTFRGLIEYIENDQQPITINGLLKTTIIQATKELNKSWCVSVFEDNAGIIEFDDQHNIVFKVETHNHPSAIEPYGGAGTGIGGVIRDSLGTGLGAKPILNTNVFCLGLPDLDYNQLPKGSLHPKRVFKGVVSGVRDYGNRMGIPTANGAILFDYRYTCNPLVYCGNVGIIPANRCQKKVALGDAIVVIGGRTGRDGIHGATFSSLELDDSSENLGSVVQIGNPIVEKKITDVLIQARDLNLYNCITDCGAGGFSSAIGEMGADCGAEVYLDDVLLKYEGLAPWEIWLSEAQERMVIAVPPHNLDTFLEICQAESVEVTVLGKFTDTKKLHIHYQGHILADLDMDFLHHGIPRITKRAVWTKPLHPDPDFERSTNLTDPLHQILASPNVASKEWVIRQYDHEVQGGMTIKPLVGIENDGPSDACVTLPVLGSKKGVVIANGINPLFGDIDPYHMAASAIDEAIRNVIAVGGRFDRVALLDNFSWGNPDKPDRLGGLVRAAQACYDIALAYGTPFISGKDSLYNEYRDTSTGDQLAIPSTLLISAISVIDNVDTAITMDAKSPGNLIYVIGKTYDEIGGSHYNAIHDFVGNSVPVVRPEIGKRVIQSLNHAIDQRLIRSCHDCSEGGIGVASAEMAFAGGFGMDLDLSNVPRNDQTNADDLILFSESNSRFIVEIAPKSQKEFENAMIGVPISVIGQVIEGKEFTIDGIETGQKVVDTTIDQLKASWQGTFNW
ncbi:TPA: phosphoribosylformylglycinamidine synthase subunit PurL [Candidatus Poribacteria bacterium]|nr:phosphoribosylformylglycinamidine synthase subunit PurL [Candidatus Poribacteria bacterium]